MVGFLLQSLELFFRESFRRSVPANRPGNVMCPFQLDGVECPHSYTISKFGVICGLGVWAPRDHKHTSINVRKISPFAKSQSAAISNKKLTKWRGQAKRQLKFCPSELLTSFLGQVKVTGTILTLLDFGRQGLPPHENSSRAIEFCPYHKFKQIFDLER